MPVHDWTRLHAGEFHSFHNGWISELGKALNRGLLPEGYYALGEQHASREPDTPYKPDVLTLERRGEALDIMGEADGEGGLAVTAAPPRASLTAEADLEYLYALQRRTLTIRHVSGDQPVALVEIASPGNKDRWGKANDFVDKCTGALRAGLHLVVIDLFPPRPHDPQGLAVAVATEAGLKFNVPPGRQVHAASFEVGAALRAYAEPFDIGQDIPVHPLFYKAGWYVNLPLQATYTAAFAGMPHHLRKRLEESA